MLEKELEKISITLRQKLADEKTKYNGKVYHYTSANGLKEILESGKLWFSNARFLNDSSENNYIFALFPKFPDAYKEKLLHKKFFELITEIANSYLQNDYCDIDNNRWWADHIYVASFSKDSDNLGLWNYYTKTQNSVGYNLGFMTMPFNVVDPLTLSFIYGEVIYDRKKQLKLIKSIILTYNDIFETNRNLFLDGSQAKQLFVKSFIDTLEVYNIFFKHEAYKDEQEYRCAIYNINNYAGLNCQTRIIDGLFVPYFEIPFEKNIVSSITISPTNNASILKKGLEIFNIFHEYGSIPIYKSQIPKRY